MRPLTDDIAHDILMAHTMEAPNVHTWERAKSDKACAVRACFTPWRVSQRESLTPDGEAYTRDVISRLVRQPF